MRGRRGIELMELLAVKLLLAGVWLAVRGGHEMATASMLDEGLAVIREVGPEDGDRSLSGTMPSLKPPVPSSWVEPDGSRLRSAHDMVRPGPGLAVFERSTATAPVMVGTYPLHEN